MDAMKDLPVFFVQPGYCSSIRLRCFPKCTFALISNNGRKFRWAEETPPQALAHSYLRPFYLYEHNTLHGLANEAELFHAPPTGEILTQPEQELKKQMTWEPDNNITQVLYDYVASVASETAKLNHVGLAFVTPTLLEVRSECHCLPLLLLHCLFAVYCCGASESSHFCAFYVKLYKMELGHRQSTGRRSLAGRNVHYTHLPHFPRSLLVSNTHRTRMDRGAALERY